MLSKRTALVWLQIVLLAVLVYAILLVVAGSVAGSLFSWFGFGPDESIDTGMSLVLGYPTHALFNVPFAFALGIPLVSLRGSARS